MDFLKNGSYDFFKNTPFGMWKMSPKTPHTQFLCRVHFHKLALKTHRGAVEKFHYSRDISKIKCINFFLNKFQKHFF
jgi:hypothetical protein